MGAGIGRQILIALSILFAAILGGFVGYLLRKYLVENRIQAARERAKQILAEAETRAREIELAARDEAMRLRDRVEAELNRRRAELQRTEERLQNRLEAIERRFEQIENRERRLNQRQSQIDKRFNELQKKEETIRTELERIAGLSAEEAKAELLRMVEEETRQDMARVIRQVEAEMQEKAEEKARELITMAIERIASDHVAETTVATVPLPSDEMKGRIIGRQGRNIRAIEMCAGVDLVVDDTPEAIIISCFDPVRREVARMALNKLVQDGRIHPARIEREVNKARQEVERQIREAGEAAVIETGLQGLHPELLKLIGRLKYRTSYGQNQYYHAIETAHIAGMLAAELGADVKIAKMGGLLHDIGKAVSHEVEGPHSQVGAEIARRYGVPEKVVNIIASHHHETEAQSLEAIIVAAADAISGARPGARREALEAYIRRVTALEEIANSFEGVQQSYAIQAGRELRIIVKPEEIDDLAAIRLAKEIARKVEDNLEYPGQIKVTVIRETRSVEYAK
ncbi:MAG TPA: ribonuclease Y [Caldilineae bacterium]|nr:ribonuclease Y [Caldilineae bacterium]